MLVIIINFVVVTIDKRLYTLLYTRVYFNFLLSFICADFVSNKG